MNLRAGILAGSPAWQELLHQVGFPCTPVRSNIPFAGSVSCLVVDRMPDPDETAQIKAYLGSGGAVMGFAAFVCPAVGMDEREARMSYITDDEGDTPWFSLIDIVGPCSIPREANMFRTPERTRAAFVGPWKGGIVAALPMNPVALAGYLGQSWRRFPSPVERLPFERVATVGRKDLVVLLQRTLRELHTLRGLPFRHLAWIPDGCSGVIGLRLDTDSSTPEMIDAFHTTAERLSMPFSWFIDVKSHEPWIKRFAELHGHEVGIHCYEHLSFDSAEQVAGDISHARNLLETAGIDSRSYAAPFGQWSLAVAQGIETGGFLYSSEFGAGYDGVPFRPMVGERRIGVLQVPVHPVSPGSLRRSGYRPEQMVRYYRNVRDQAFRAGLPLFLYDHPIHGFSRVMEEVIVEAKTAGVRSMTLGEYAGWWGKRRTFLEKAEMVIQGDDVVITGPTCADVPLRAVDGSATPPAERCIDAIPETRAFDLRSWIGMTTTRIMRRTRR